MKKLLYFITIIITFSYCSEEVKLPPNNNDVSIKTGTHTRNSEGGVTLFGEIKNVEVPIEYGFLIVTEENSTYNNRYPAYSKLDAGVINGEFSQEFKSDLYQGTTYYYNTFAIKNGEYIYGKEKVFFSQGSASPQIKSIVPKKAHLGDTITIKGLYFSKRPEVFFNKVKSRLLINNDTLIKCIVTNNPDVNKELLPNLELKIKTSTQNETLYKDFALYTPKIDSVRPYEIFMGDTLTIYGDHFGTTTTANRLYLKNNNSAPTYKRLLKASRKELVFIIGGIEAYKPSILIESQHQTIQEENKIKHILPQITGVSKKGVKYGDKLTIYGSNFPNTNYYSSDFLEYKLGTKKVYFSEMYRDSLVLEIKDNSHNLDFTMKGVSVALFDNKINFDEEIVLNEDYVRVSFNQGKLYASGKVGEDLYAFEYPYYANRKYLVKMNKETNYFEKTSPDASKSMAASSYNLKFNGTKCYSLSVKDGQFLWHSYNVLTHTEKQLATFPGKTRNNPIMAVAGNFLYVGLGGYSSSNKVYDDMYKYSIAENKWEFVRNFPKIDANSFPKNTSINFTIGDKIYIGGRQRDARNKSVDFWEFNTKTNTVSRKSDLPITIPQTTEGIVINNKAFFDYEGTTYIYTPEKDQWSSKQTGMSINGHNSFFLQTKEFVYSRNSNYVIKIKKSYFND